MVGSERVQRSELQLFFVKITKAVANFLHAVLGHLWSPLFQSVWDLIVKTLSIWWCVCELDWYVCCVCVEVICKFYNYLCLGARGRTAMRALVLVIAFSPKLFFIFIHSHTNLFINPVDRATTQQFWTINSDIHIFHYGKIFYLNVRLHFKQPPMSQQTHQYFEIWHVPNIPDYRVTNIQTPKSVKVLDVWNHPISVKNERLQRVLKGSYPIVKVSWKIMVSLTPTKM